MYNILLVIVNTKLYDHSVLSKPLDSDSTTSQQ